MLTRRIDDSFSWRSEVLPFVSMLTTTCLDMIGLTIIKAAMNDGLGSIAYLVYSNVLGTLILLPFYMVHICRNIGRPRLTVHIMFKFFILGLIGRSRASPLLPGRSPLSHSLISYQRLSLSQGLMYVGIQYSTPTLLSAIWNLGPAITFTLAIIFRMEKIDITSPSTVAKLIGTVIAISGAMVFTFYQGPGIFLTHDSSDLLLSLQPSNRIFGGLIMFISTIFGCMWSVLHTATAKEFPDQFTIVFFFCLFGTIQCIALSPFLEPNFSAWRVQPGIRMTAIVLGAVYTIIFRVNAVTWCLEKKGPLFVAMFSPLAIVIAVIMGVTFLGDSLHLGSAIGAVVISAGFYTVIWGQAKEKNKLEDEMDKGLGFINESGSSDQNAPLLQS